jgi:hypothetical protein
MLAGIVDKAVILSKGIRNKKARQKAGLQANKLF